MIDLRSLRKSRGLTQTDLAKLLGVGQPRITRIESKPDTVCLGQVVQILDVLGYKLDAVQQPNWAPQEKPLQAYVYVIPHRLVPAVKIGKANDVGLRVAAFGDVDADAGIYLVGESDKHALTAESLLHKAFKKWRIKPDAAEHLGLEKDGATEWFDISCVPRVRRFVKSNADLIGLKLCDPPTTQER